MAAKLLKLRRGTTTQHGTFTGAEGEVTVDTDKDVLVVNDGLTAGGHPLAAEDMSNVSSASIAGRLSDDSIATSKLAAGALPTDVTVSNANLVNGTVTNADVNGSAAIAGTKISPDFGSQNIVTTGTLGSGNITISNNAPSLYFTEGDADPDYQLLVNGGQFRVYDVTNSTNRIVVNTDGHVDITGNLDVGAGADITGNITVTGTVDGRDVAADGTKLDSIDTGAKDDQTAAEIRVLVEAANDSNVFTDADHSKLNGIQAGATDNQTAAEIKTLLQSDKLTSSEITSGTIGSGLLANDAVTFAKIENIAQNTFLARLSSGSGSVEELSASQVRGILNVANGATSYTSNQATDTTSNVSFGTINCSSLTATGNVTAFSDATLKTDIHTINDALGIVGKLRGVTYKWLSNGEADIGVIAQEVQKVVPEVIKETEDGIKTVDYGRLVSVLINAVNELKSELDEHIKGGK